MADLMQEVQDILGGARDTAAPKKSRTLAEMKDPADEAFDLLKTSAELGKMIQQKLDAVLRAFGAAKQQAERLDKMGAGGALASLDLIAASPMKALHDLRKLVDEAISEIDRVVKHGSQGRGMMGRRENLERYLGWLDSKIASLSEASPKPYKKPTPDNDYSPELLAAATDAANYLSSPSQLEPGTKVVIGRKALYVVGTPKMVDQGCLVTLGDQNDPNQPGDAYDLVLPLEFQGDESEPPAMDDPQLTVEPTAEAILSRNGRSVKVIAADIRLNEEDYGDHMYDYADFGPAMDRIKPGDRIAWMNPTMVMRVIGREGSAALVQPDAMDAEMYGTFRAAAQYSSVPVGQEAPTVPQTTMWQPGMAPIPSNRDFPGRGGTHALDTSTSAPQATLTGQGGFSGGERTSLVGTRVLNYNPHTGKYSMVTGKMPGDYEMADTIQIVGHDPSLPAAVGESMTLQRFELVLDEAIGSTPIAKLRHVVESGKVMKVNGVLMDPCVASVMLQFHCSVSEENRARMGKMGVVEMLTVSQRMLARLTEGKAKTTELIRRGSNARLYKLDNGGLRLMLDPPLPSLELPPNHARTKAMLALAKIKDDDDFTDAAAEFVGGKERKEEGVLGERTYSLRKKKRKVEGEEGDGSGLSERTYTLRKKKRKNESGGGLSDVLGDAIDEG